MNIILGLIMIKLIFLGLKLIFIFDDLKDSHEKYHSKISHSALGLINAENFDQCRGDLSLIEEEARNVNDACGKAKITGIQCIIIALVCFAIASFMNI